MSGLLQTRRVSLALHVLFLASGAVALMYEVLWMRRFAVIIGATGPATAAVLAALFLGLAIGSIVFGRLVARWQNPIRAFGFLEIGIGAAALLSEAMLRRVEPLLPRWHAALEGQANLALLVDVLVVVSIVLLPTILMGGTLPTLAQAVTSAGEHLGTRGGALYALNTAGAALGALSVPLLLLPVFGAGGALATAMTGSLVIGACALLLSGGSVEAVPEASVPGARQDRRPAPSPGTLGTGVLGLLAFSSGMLLLGLEVLWTRMLALVHESATHSFALVTALFLAGLALGAGIGRRVAQGGAARARAALEPAWVVAGLAVIASPLLFGRLTSGLMPIAGTSWSADQVRMLLVGATVLLPATILAGMILPLLMELAGSRGGQPGEVIGRLLGANLAGCVLGPLAAAFLLAPLAGLWGSIVVAGLGMLVLGGAVTRGRSVLAAIAFVVALPLIAAALALPPTWLAPGEHLVFVRDGAMGTVAVVENVDGSRRMKLDNTYTIGGTLSTGDERMQAHVPLLLHPDPRRVAFLGLGTGITAGAALLHEIPNIEIVEIVPEIADAAGAAFGEANLGVTTHPRVTMRRQDARTWLLSQAGRFDVVVGDLFVPWRRGESRMYSMEQFEAARSALAPGGLFCQWVPTYQVSEDDFGSLAATFLEVFPSATLWRSDFRAGQSALALVGWREPAAFDPESADSRAEALALQPDPANPYLAAPAGLWLHLIGPLRRDDEWLAGAPMLSDARPLIELGSRVARSAGADREASLFVGPKLDAQLDRIAASPREGTPLAALDPSHLRWQEAGASLWRASRLAEDGRMDEADALGLATLASLPEAIQVATMGRTLTE